MTLVNPYVTKRSSVPNSELTGGADNEAYLFETPSDLLCPITHELFHEPVINAAGQVYERSAIEKALAHRMVDPISNLPLETAGLTTVWPMKSKAAAYRERAVRGCIEHIWKPSCRAPIRYLRRAAELSADAIKTLDLHGTVLGLPGLTRGVVEYLLTHPSSIYDFQALSRFAASLAASGHRDKSAGVYTKLLQLNSDCAQQVEALQGLLACWNALDDDDEQKLVERLAALACGEGSEACRPAHFVRVLLDAGLPEDMVLRFCEHILGGTFVTSAALTSNISGWSGRNCSGEPCGVGPAAGAAPGIGAGAHADLLFAYTKLRCLKLEAAMADQRSADSSADSRQQAEECSAGEADNVACGRPSDESVSKGRREPVWRRGVQRAVCSTIYAVLSLSGSANPLARALKTASVLVLLSPALRSSEG